MKALKKGESEVLLGPEKPAEKLGWMWQARARGSFLIQQVQTRGLSTQFVVFLGTCIFWKIERRDKSYVNAYKDCVLIITITYKPVSCINEVICQRHNTARLQCRGQKKYFLQILYLKPARCILKHHACLSPYCTILRLILYDSLNSLLFLIQS